MPVVALRVYQWSKLDQIEDDATESIKILGSGFRERLSDLASNGGCLALGKYR